MASPPQLRAGAVLALVALAVFAAIRRRPDRAAVELGARLAQRDLRAGRGVLVHAGRRVGAGPRVVAAARARERVGVCSNL